VIRLRKATRDPNQVVYLALIVGVVLFPILAGFISPGDSGSYLLSQAADAGVYVLLAIGLNVVVGFAGLLDLGYAAFFAIGAYTYALLASSQLSSSPLHHAIHLPFWILLLLAVSWRPRPASSWGRPPCACAGTTWRS
jgi:branched-chain amino acid transport system permease protein